MTKNDLIISVNKCQNYVSEEETRQAMEILLEELATSLEKNERIELRGFGSFCLRLWGPRYARNPETGESWRTQPVYAIHFRPAYDFRMRVDNSRINAVAISEERYLEETAMC